MDVELLWERARIIRQVRSFFDTRDYLELDTPLLSPDLIPESCLEVFATSRILPDGSSKPYWLIPSPELWMKKIIAQHRVSIYQICKCFRNGESAGFLHTPEFTMLEYYTTGANYLDSLTLTETLLASISQQQDSAFATTRFCPPFERLTVAEAFARYAGFDLLAAAEKPGVLAAEARRLGLDPPPAPDDALSSLFDLIFIHAIEPRLKQQQPVALLDYPAFVSTLAKPGKDGKTVERWELYYNGIELANCYSEETDQQRVRDFFEHETKAKQQQSMVQHHVDHDYWKIFTPQNINSGVALGLDRLIMALLGKSTIDSVVPFPMR